MLREVSFTGIWLSQGIAWIDAVRTPKFSLVFLVAELLSFGFIIVWFKALDIED